MRRIVLALVVALGLTLGGSAAPAHGGANLHPVQDRYEPGDIATYVGYVVPSSAGGWVDDGPYFTWATPAGAGDRVLLGQPSWAPAPALGPRVLRVSITFAVPTDLTPGHYELMTCNERCGKGLGDLAGGTLHVGVDPSGPIHREWPPDEPEIVNLPSGAVLSMPALGQSAARTEPSATVASATGLQPRPSVPPATVAPGRATPHGPDASPVALALGGMVAVVCVGLVLVALRDG